jgi:hypothetical protein
MYILGDRIINVYIKERMNSIWQKVFLYAINVSYILYLIVLLGVGGYAPQYLDYLRNFLKFYIAFILIILYNPLVRVKKKFDEFDRRIAFSSGIFLLLSTTIIASLEEYIRIRTQLFVTDNIL